LAPKLFQLRKKILFSDRPLDAACGLDGELRLDPVEQLVPDLAIGVEDHIPRTAG
jgi:hypothetical protein